MTLIAAAGFNSAEGACTSDLLQKLLERGFSNQEITALCSGSEVPAADQPELPGKSSKQPKPISEEGDIASSVIGTWKCRTIIKSQLGEVTKRESFRIQANGNYELTDKLGDTAPEADFSHSSWGTYKLNPRGGNRAVITFKPQGSTLHVVPPRWTVMFSMPHRDVIIRASGGSCDRTS